MNVTTRLRFSTVRRTAVLGRVILAPIYATAAMAGLWLTLNTARANPIGQVKEGKYNAAQKLLPC